MSRNVRSLYLLAPLLLLLGTFVHPEEPFEGAALYPVLRDHPVAWAASHWLLLAGVTALIAVVLSLTAQIADSAPRLSRLVACFGVVGCTCAAAVFGISLAVGQAGEGPEGAMVPLLDRVLPLWLVLFPGTLALLTALLVAVSVLAATGKVSPPLAAVTGGGVLGAILAPEPFACIGAGLFLVGLVLVARRLDRRPDPVVRPREMADLM